MRIEPAEECMYHRMDQKDRLAIVVPLCGLPASLGFFLLAARYPAALGISMIAVSMMAMAGSIIGYFKVKRQIMPVNDCCLEIRKTCFVAVQPYQNETYETCRIYFDEIEGLVKGKKSGGFYVRVADSGNSQITGENGRQQNLFFVNPFGYSKDNIDTIYGIIKERAPETAKVYEYGA